MPFVDRLEAMAVIVDAWQRAVEARRQFVYVTGEAGVGKTRLVKEAGRRIAADGGLVLFGRCDRDSPIAYQPFVEALDGYVAAIPPDELALLSPLARRELAALFPAAGDPPPGGSESPANVFGAVPSLHVAYATLVVCVVWSQARWLRAAALGFALSIAFAAVYLRHHYIIDVVAGVLLALLVHGLSWALRRFVSRSRDQRARRAGAAP